MALTEFVDHLVFFVASLDRTERFYTALLSQNPEHSDDSLMYCIGDTRLFFAEAEDPTALHNKEGVGLNHLAFGVRSLVELESIKTRLDKAQITHSGIMIDRYGQREFIWLDDPDEMRVEFYLRPVKNPVTGQQ